MNWMWLAQALSFLNFLALDFAPELKELIQSLSLWLTFLLWWLPNQVTWIIRSLELSSRWRATPSHHQTAEMAMNRQRHLVVPHHVHHPSLARRLTPDCPETRYCLGIQVILTEDRGTTPPPSHAWQVPVVEDMFWDSKSGLKEAVVLGPCWAILFYGRWSLGEGLSLGKARDATFTLSGTISWVGKQAQLNANALSQWKGQQLIAQAITEWSVEARRPGCPCTCLPVLPPFSFCSQDGPLPE